MISINEIIVKALSISPGRTHGSAERVIIQNFLNGLLAILYNEVSRNSNLNGLTEVIGSN